MTLQQVITELKLRRSRGVNFSRLGSDMGITGAYLAAIRDGKRLNPSWSMVNRISDHLEATKLVSDK